MLSHTDSLLRYVPSLQLQEQLVAKRKAGTSPDTLLIVQVCSRVANLQQLAHNALRQQVLWRINHMISQCWAAVGANSSNCCYC